VTRISLGTNLAAQSLLRRLSDSTSALGRSFERLSSGLRINRASDDAAGLAIATQLNADSRVYNQGVRNVNDAISLLNVAEGVVSELSTILFQNWH